MTVVKIADVDRSAVKAWRAAELLARGRELSDVNFGEDGVASGANAVD